MKSKQKSSKTLLSDKISEALTVKPKADIEDDQIFGTNPKTVKRADISSSESEDEFAISNFRKQNINLLSDINKKYEGEVVTQKDLSQTESDLDQSDDADDVETNGKLVESSVHSDSGEAESDSHITSQSNLLEDATDSESDAESDDYSITKFQKDTEGEGSEEDDGDGIDISQLEEPTIENFEHVKKQNVSEEAKKGACVRSQLLLWEGMLEMRIHLQRCMNTANQMPMPDTFSELKTNESFVAECNTAKTNVCNVLDKFLQLQNMLLKKFPETKNISSSKDENNTKTVKANNKTPATQEDSDEEIPSDTDNEEIPSDTEPEDNLEDDNNKKSKETTNTTTKKRKLEDYEKDIAKTHKSFKPFRDSTIQKWNDKTRLATAANFKNAPVNTILQQISYILSDRSKLVRRTHLKRSVYDIVGYTRTSNNTEEDNLDNLGVKGRKDDDEYIPEIFDDSDFYHQLLRELIECKSADISDPVQLSRQWIALQQMRSKMKRKVDTKATKGRKIKYVVHNKLVNFMAPEKCNTWNDESTNELYSSLFGKMYEQNNIGLNVTLDSNIKVKE